MEKKLSLITLLIAIVVCCSSTLCLSSCSNDDQREDIEVKFSLLNEKGEKATTFKSSENILFDLKVTNNTHNDIDVIKEIIETDESRLIINSLGIYDNKNNLLGLPYDNILTGVVVLKPNESAHLQTCWLVNDNIEVDFSPFNVRTLKEQLPSGDYYTQFSINNKLYRYDFRIEQ